MQKNADKWPILIKSGSVTVRVYQTVNRGRPLFTVSYHEAGGRRLRQFAELSKARREAKIIADQLSAGEGRALELTGKDRDSYVYAVRKLKPLDVPLNVVIDEYLKARAYDVPLVEAARSYAETHKDKLPDKAVEEVLQEMLQAKKKDGVSESYQIALKSLLGRFAADFRTSIANVQTPEIDGWLRGLKLSARTRNNFRTAITVLFNYAKTAGYLNRDRTTAAEHTTAARVKVEAIEVFTPAEFASLLTAADDTVLPFFALGGFCGLRTAEIERLTWQDILWSEGHVVISAAIAKTRVRRLAPLTDAAAAWLANWKGKKGQIIDLDKLYQRLGGICKTAGVKWKNNALRHSWITYRLAMSKDTMRTAVEAGNSPQIIRSNYDAVASEQEGKLWFSVMPKTAANVIQMQGAA